MKKKLILATVFFITCITINAQEKYNKNIVNNVTDYIENAEKNIALTSEEKVKLFDLRCEHTSQFFQTTAAYKDQPELAEKRKEINLNYQKSVIAAFGKERGLAILKAVRPAK